MGYSLLAKKPMSLMLEESRETGEHSLKRTLGPVSLTALGVGAIIGAGIFVLSGLGAHYAGPGLMLSFVISGFGCAFAGLCYAEFSAMIPLAGSAYTYAYAALGELMDRAGRLEAREGDDAAVVQLHHQHRASADALAVGATDAHRRDLVRADVARAPVVARAAVEVQPVGVEVEPPGDMRGVARRPQDRNRQLGRHRSSVQPA